MVGSPLLRNWIGVELPDLVPIWNLQVTPLQQLDALIDEFCSGCTLSYGIQFKPITHVGGGIWELKTPDLRIFGWFHRKDCFVAYRAENATYVKEHNLYKGLAGEAARFRDKLDLNEPKFVRGDDPNDVVSNYS